LEGFRISTKRSRTWNNCSKGKEERTGQEDRRKEKEGRKGPPVWRKIVVPGREGNKSSKAAAA